VLEQQARVRNLAPDPLLMQPPLQLPGFLIVNAPAKPGKYQLIAHTVSLAAPELRGPAGAERDIA
jgi:hypothetical protein